MSGVLHAGGAVRPLAKETGTCIRGKGIVPGEKERRWRIKERKSGKKRPPR